MRNRRSGDFDEDAVIERLHTAREALRPTPPPVAPLLARAAKIRRRRMAAGTGSVLAVAGAVAAAVILIVPTPSSKTVPAATGAPTTVPAAPTVQSGPSSPRSHSTPSPGTPASAGHSVRSAPRCTLHQLRITWSPKQMGLAMMHGTLYFILLRNDSAHTCELSGTPTLRMVSPPRHFSIDTGWPAMQPRRGEYVVLLHEGQRAAAVLHVGTDLHCDHQLLFPTKWGISLPGMPGSEVITIPNAMTPRMQMCAHQPDLMISPFYSPKKNPGLP